MGFTDNPVADFEKYDAEHERIMSRLPVCCLCGERIQQDTAVYFYGKWVCDDCLDDMRKETLEDAV